MSLWRPRHRKISFEVPCSDDSGIPFTLESGYNDDPDAERYSTNYNDLAYIVNKRPGEAFFLTVGDLLANMGAFWEYWLESERDIHYHSHEGPGCDSDVGLPDRSICSDNKEDEQDVAEDSCIDEVEKDMSKNKERYRLKLNQEY